MDVNVRNAGKDILQCYQDSDDNKCFVRHGMIDPVPSGGLLHPGQTEFVQTVPGADFSLNRNRNRKVLPSD